jgi:tetrahydromethanopterin S-methyltransferase subunit C
VQTDILLITSLIYVLFFSKETSKNFLFFFPIGKVTSLVQTYAAVVSPLTFFLFPVVAVLSHTIWNSVIGRNVSSVSLGRPCVEGLRAAAADR